MQIDDNRDDNDDSHWRPWAPARHVPRWDVFREQGDCPAWPGSSSIQWTLLHLDQPLTVDALAARASMSPRTFARRFRQRTGATLGWWVNRQRVLLAARLLERGNDTIASVSARSGFGSPGTLRRHFIQARGVTPDRYRQAFRITEPETSTPGPAGHKEDTTAAPAF